MVAPANPAQAVAPIYVLHGRDDYLRRLNLQHTIGRVLGKDPQPVAITRFDGPEAGLADVLDELRTLPLLGPRRLVVVDQADDFVKRHRDALERYLASPSPTGALVLLCDSWPSTTRLARLVQQAGHAVRCEPPPPRQIPPWLVQYAAQHHHKRLAPQVAQNLLDLVGNDLATLCSHLDKLAIYVADAPAITDQDVEDLVGFHRHEKVFGIIDAAEQADLARALGLWHQVLATDRDAPFRAIGGLAWALRRLIQQRQAQTRPARPSRLNAAQLQHHLASLAQADQAVKTGAASIQSVVEKFIVDLCTR
jgi:DNA polymerase-3 subunit delta